MDTRATDQDEADNALKSCAGRMILGWGQDKDGLHMILDDGKSVIFYGPHVYVYVVQPVESPLH